jgi:MipA family protein
MKSFCAQVSVMLVLSSPAAAQVREAAPEVAAQQTAPLPEAGTNGESEPKNDWSGYVAAGVGVRNQYLGSKDFELTPAVLGRISYRSFFLEFQGEQARLNLSPLPRLTFGPAFDAENGRDSGVKNLKVGRLPKIDDAYQLGGFVGYRFGDLLREDDEVSAQITYLRDVSDTYDGGIGQVQLAYGTNFGDRWSLGASVKGTYVDRKYARTYFGITPAQSTASGLAVYDLKGGVRDVQLGGRIGYALTEQWSLQAIGSYKRLLGDFKDSPVVRDGGSPNQLSGAVGIAFRF